MNTIILAGMSSVTVRTHTNNELLLGDFGDKFYIILEGTVSVLVPWKKEKKDGPIILSPTLNNLNNDQ